MKEQVKKQTSKAIVETQATTQAVKEQKQKYELVDETFDDLGEGTFESDIVSGYDEVYFVKAKTKDLAYFEFSKKSGNTIYKDPRTNIVTIDGLVNKIEMDSYTYDNKEIKTLKIHLVKTIKEKSILFILSLSYTQTARSIINSLLGCNKEIEKINITLYKNQAGYTSVKMSINGSKSEWKYSIEEQKKHIDVIKNKKGEFVSNDYSELDELFEDALRKHLPTIQPNKEHVLITDKIDNPDEDEATFGELENTEAEDFFEIDSEKD